jgi:hypothetical protein
MPTKVDSDFVLSAGADQTTLTTKSFTVQNNDVIIVKATTWQTDVGMGTPTGGSQSYSKYVEAAPGGFSGYAVIYGATVSGSPAPFTISSSPTVATNTRHTLCVEIWRGAKLAVSPAVNGTLHGTGDFSTPLVTTLSGSVISWCMCEEKSIDPSTRQYLLGDTEDGIYDGHVGSNSVQYFAYAAVGAAGSYNFGLLAPTGLNWTAAAIEIQNGVVNGSGTIPFVTTGSMTGVVVFNGSATIPFTTTASLAVSTSSPGPRITQRTDYARISRHSNPGHITKSTDWGRAS